MRHILSLFSDTMAHGKNFSFETPGTENLIFHLLSIMYNCGEVDFLSHMMW